MARTFFGIAAAILLAAGPVSAQGLDLSGDWDLTASAFFGQQPEGSPGPDCQFSGSATIVQDGSDLGGTAELTLITGATECPAEMSAEVDGTVSGNQVEMGLLMGGNLGTAQWTGSSSPPSDGELSLNGGFLVETGPFAGTTGNWSGQLVGEPAPSVLEIPTLTTLGVVALVALLLAAAGWMLRRRPAAGSRSA